jgi:F-type H+-transporting ATPase subunit epsilon
MSTFTLEIVTPEKALYSGVVGHLQAPGTEGSFGVLSGHAPLLSGLETGAVSFSDEDGASHKMAISGGFVEVAGNRVTILAETAERAEEIDVDRARAAGERARKRMTNKNEIDAVRAAAALARALNRLKVASS